MKEHRMNKLPLILGFGIILDVVILDQVSKWAAIELLLRPALDAGESVGLLEWIMGAPEKLGFISVPVLPNFNMTMVWNHGVSFGLLQNMGIWPLVILAGIICMIMMRWLIKSTSKLEAISLGMIIGGAIGNVIDRFRFGAVADFFDVYVGTYHWPAFNIADSAISIGVVLLLVHGFFMDKKDEK